MKQVVIVAPKGKTNLSSVAGAYEILVRANSRWQSQGNRQNWIVTIAGFEREVMLDSGIFSIHPADLAEVSHVDMIIIPSISYSEKLIGDNQKLIDWIKEQYFLGAEIATMCSGAFLLAATGLLEGKNCSTHWVLAEKFKSIFPNINLQTDKVITAENGIYTNGGAFSFLHLMLFLVERNFNRETAIHCSKIFQIDMDRFSQSPFSIFEMQKNHGDDLIRDAQTYIEENLSRKISFEALAVKLATSRRNFDRRFIKATGNTPVEYLQRAKVEIAKAALEKGRKSIFQIMEDVGYADEKAFREVFKRITGISPMEYRERYSKEAAVA